MSELGEERSGRSREHWVVLWAAGLVVLGLLALGLLLVPDVRGHGTHEQLGLDPCFPMVAWNFPCPGCGVTTSVAHAARGELGAALRVQPFGLLLAAGAVLFVLWTLRSHARGRDLWVEIHRLDGARWATAGLVALGLAWLYKIAAVRGWF